MDGVPTGVCGYEWPADCPRVDDAGGATTCIRESLPDADRCVWHAHPDETSHDLVEWLQETEPAADEQVVSADGARFGAAAVQDSALLDGVRLRGSDLSELGLWHVDLSGVVLRGADLSGATVWEVGLAGADLRETNCSDTLLNGGDLTRARFQDSDLSDATIQNTDCSDADFAGADLRGTQFAHTILTGATVAGVTVDSETTVESPTDPPPRTPDADGDHVYDRLERSLREAGHHTAARRLQFRVSHARRLAVADETGAFGPRHLALAFVELLTGYGTSFRPIVATSLSLLSVATVSYVSAGVANPLRYSLVTFAAFPPGPLASLPVWAQIVAGVEALGGTLLLVSLVAVFRNSGRF